MTNIRLDMNLATEEGVFDSLNFPQEIISGFGVSYARVKAQSSDYSLHFFDCSSIPENLPNYLKVYEFTPDMTHFKMPNP